MKEKTTTKNPKRKYSRESIKSIKRKISLRSRFIHTTYIYCILIERQKKNKGKNVSFMQYIEVN